MTGKIGAVDVGSDGASANQILYQLEKASVGDHLIFAWCISHKAQFALYDAFNGSQLETDALRQLENEFYLFKKASLKWRLFKRYAWENSLLLQAFRRYKVG